MSEISGNRDPTLELTLHAPHDSTATVEGQPTHAADEQVFVISGQGIEALSAAQLAGCLKALGYTALRVEAASVAQARVIEPPSPTYAERIPEGLFITGSDLTAGAIRLGAPKLRLTLVRNLRRAKLALAPGSDPIRDNASKLTFDAHQLAEALDSNALNKARGFGERSTSLLASILLAYARSKDEQQQDQ